MGKTFWRKIHISYPFMLLTAALIALDREGLVLLSWSAVVVHELGHLAAIRLLGMDIRRIELRLSGLKIEYTSGSQTSYLQDALAALAGPAAGAVSAGVLTVAARLWPLEWLYVLIGCHVVLTLFNLLPALPMDGGRIALAVLGHTLGQDRAAGAVQAFTGVTGALMTAAGLWLLLESGGASFVLLLTGITVLLGSIAEPRGRWLRVI